MKWKKKTEEDSVLLDFKNMKKELLKKFYLLQEAVRNTE
jgi:hypothetical protein